MEAGAGAGAVDSRGKARAGYIINYNRERDIGGEERAKA